MTVNHLILFAEFQKIALATAIGFAIMGFIGFFVKLIHIPINNIIVQWHLFMVSSFPVLPSNNINESSYWLKAEFTLIGNLSNHDSDGTKYFTVVKFHIDSL